MKEATNSTSLLHIFNGRWLVGLGVIAMSLVFGRLICMNHHLHPHKVGFFLKYHQIAFNQSQLHKDNF